MKTQNVKSPAKATKTTTKVNTTAEAPKAEKPRVPKMVQIQARIKALQEKKTKEGLNTQEIAWLLNAVLKLEDKTPSAVYNKLCKAKEGSDVHAYVLEALGKSKMPDFKQFVSALVKGQPKTKMYSNWDGIRVLVGFNKLASTKTKVQRQNKKEAAK